MTMDVGSDRSKGSAPKATTADPTSLGLIVTGDGGQDPSDRDEIGRRVEAGLEPEGVC